MAGELSPDRLYYWDGRLWVSTTSSDGRLRWDGGAWQPLRGQPSRSRHVALIVGALGGGFALLLGVLAFATATVAWPRLTSLFQTPAIVCNSPLANAGTPAFEGDQACGGKLGASIFNLDCTQLSAAAPPGIYAQSATAGGSDWHEVKVPTSDAGCRVAAASNHDTFLQLSDAHPADAVMIADFVLLDRSSAIGMQVACTARSTCTGFIVWADGSYSLAEGKSGSGWNYLARGQLGGFGAPPLKIGSANRLIMRASGSDVRVFLNGRELAHATTKSVPVSGIADFYIDTRETNSAGAVLLQRLLLFEPA